MVDTTEKEPVVAEQKQLRKKSCTLEERYGYS